MDQEILKRYISGNASLKEKGQVVAWSKADPDNMKELLALRKLFDITIWKKYEGQASIKKRYKSSVLYKISAVAAVFLLLLVTNWYTLSCNWSAALT